MSDIEKKWRRRFWALLLLVIVFFIAISFSVTRGILIRPLYVNDTNAKGEIAYVMASGVAAPERLLAASDLYHWGRIKKIYLLQEQQSSSYNFVRKQSDTRLQRSIDYLQMRGVPVDAIESVPPIENHKLSSLAEAEAVARLPEQFESIVVVTSAPHTRRSKLCFERTFGSQTRISVYAATGPSQSVETHLPIWIEYAKLTIYWVFT